MKVRIFALSTLLCLGATAFAQNTNPVAVLVKAGHLVDPRTGNVASPVAVLIENGKIKEVGAPSKVQANPPAGVTIIDLGSATLLPGLIDSHTHLLLDVTVPAEDGCGCQRSEEHTSELQSLRHLVCRLLLEKKNS